MASTESPETQMIMSIDDKYPITIISKEKTSTNTLPISIDNIIYFTNMDIIKRISPVINGCIEDTDGIDAPLPLANMDENAFKMIMEYAEWENKFYNVDGADKSVIEKGSPLTEWETHYFSRPREIVFKVIIAANFLGYEKLLDRTGMYIASLISNASPEELKQMFKRDSSQSDIREAPVPAASS